MNRWIVRSLALAVAVTLAGGLLVAGQAMVTRRIIVQADIPFAFVVGTKELPAGKYYIRSTSDDKSVSFFDTDPAKERKEPIAVTTAQFADRQKEQITDQAQLVFNSYGDKNYLSEIWGAGSMEGYFVPPSEEEMRLAKNQKAERRVIGEVKKTER